MTPWPQFSKVSPKEIINMMRGSIVIDPFKVLDAKSCKSVGLEYFTLGAMN
jgi:UDPglucose 6-dehydrogenase